MKKTTTTLERKINKKGLDTAEGTIENTACRTGTNPENPVYEIYVTVTLFEPESKLVSQQVNMNTTRIQKSQSLVINMAITAYVTMAGGATKQ